MTDSDLRELDGWIAEKFLHWDLLGTESGDRWWSGVSDETGLVCWSPISVNVFRPTVEPTFFALVKREIERRGWGWHCERENGVISYQFDLFIPKGHPGEQIDPISAWEKTEELAGCLAVKAAVEGSDAHSD